MAGLVTLTLTVFNPSAALIDVLFATGQQYDFAVSEASGALLWQWSVDMAFAQMLGSVTLAPNESLSYSAEWSPSVTGELTASGALVSSSHTSSAATAFSVE